MSRIKRFHHLKKAAFSLPGGKPPATGVLLNICSKMARKDPVLGKDSGQKAGLNLSCIQSSSEAQKTKISKGEEKLHSNGVSPSSGYMFNVKPVDHGGRQQREYTSSHLTENLLTFLELTLQK